MQLFVRNYLLGSIFHIKWVEHFPSSPILSTSFAEENALGSTLTLDNELNNVNKQLTSNPIYLVLTDKTKYMISAFRTLYYI